MKKRSILFIITAAVLFFTVGNPTTGEAKTIKSVEDEINQLDEKQKDLNTKKSEVNSDKENISGEMDKNIDEQITIQEEINELNNQLNTTRADINEQEIEIKHTKDEIKELKIKISNLKDDIADLEERIEIRDELLRDRLRSIQENGGKVKYISVIFGSQNFSDLISRSAAVNTIMNQDRNIMEDHARDKEILEVKKTEVEEAKANVELKKAKQEEQMEQLQFLKNQLDIQKNKQSKLKKKLEKEYEKLEQYSFSLEEEAKIIEQQEAVIEKARILAEEEKAKLEQEERDRLARIAEKARASKNKESASGQIGTSNTAGSSSGEMSTSDNEVKESGTGLFAIPASGVFTSGFGPRWGTMHNGIDIAASRGTAVTASQTGVVSRVVTGCVEGNKRCGGGYGNHIIITHVIDGKVYASLYAHLNSVSVSAGASVSKGAVIGGVGHTGDSTGPHLHFEIHPGGYKNPVNPRQYF